MWRGIPEARKTRLTDRAGILPNSACKMAAEEAVAVEDSAEELQQTSSSGSKCDLSPNSKGNRSGDETTGLLAEFFLLWPLAVGLQKSQKQMTVSHRP